MIVKNEENILDKCLDHIHRYVDEIIIIDTGSTDKTVEIAKKYTDKIYYFVWNNNFAEARNSSLQYATKEWLLVQDADEFIQNPWKIKEFLRNTSADCVALSKINVYGDQSVANPFAEIENSQAKYFTSQEKLLRNHRGLKFTGAVHEVVIDETMNRPKIISFPEKLFHLMALNTKNNKSKYYNKLGKQALYDGDRNVNLLVRHLLFSLETGNVSEFYELFDEFSGKLKYEVRMSFLLPDFDKHLGRVSPPYKKRFLAWVANVV